MDANMIDKIVPVKLFGLEKKEFAKDGSFLGNTYQEGRYSINLLYENEFDPSDGTHKFALMPENPNFIKIKEFVERSGIEVNQYPLEELSPSLHDMYGAWVIVDLSKTPVCRVYTENVCKMVDGRVVCVHKAGTPKHKVDPKTKEDLKELAIITQLPVWGFCRKTNDGKWIWLKGNDPKVRIEREIAQGRLIYVEQDNDYTISNGPETETVSITNDTPEQTPARREIATEKASEIEGIE